MALRLRATLICVSTVAWRGVSRASPGVGPYDRRPRPSFAYEGCLRARGSARGLGQLAGQALPLSSALLGSAAPVHRESGINWDFSSTSPRSPSAVRAARPQLRTPQHLFRSFIFTLYYDALHRLPYEGTSKSIYENIT